MSQDCESWVQVAWLTDIPRRGARRVQTSRGPVAIFRTQNDRVYALRDECPHRAGPLSQGIIHDHSVTCPLHNWVISLETGLVQGEDQGCVMTIPARIEDGLVMLGVPLEATDTRAVA